MIVIDFGYFLIVYDFGVDYQVVFGKGIFVVLMLVVGKVYVFKIVEQGNFVMF